MIFITTPYPLLEEGKKKKGLRPSPLLFITTVNLNLIIIRGGNIYERF